MLTNDYVFVDQAKLLLSEQQKEITTLLETYNQNGAGRISLIIVDRAAANTPAEVQKYVETKVDGKADRIMFIFSMRDHRVKLSAGEEMQKLLTEEFRKKTLGDIVAKFTGQNYYGGIKGAIEAVMHELTTKLQK